MKFALHVIIDPAKGPKTEEIWGRFSTYERACEEARQIAKLYTGMFWWVLQEGK